MVVLSYVLAGLAFGLLITVHEFGHMLVAKRLGMYVPRFSWGFGPVLFSRKIGETEYALSAIPFGGYVKIAGFAGDEDESDGVDASDPRHFSNRPAWAKVLVLLAGPFANYLLAFAIGVPMLLTPTTAPDPAGSHISVRAGDPAAVAGLRDGDDLRAVGRNAVHDFDSIRTGISTLAKERPGEPIPFAILRDGKPMVISVTPSKEGLVGIAPGEKVVPPMSLGEAIPQAIRNIGSASAESLSTVKKLFTRQASVNQLSGPIGIITATAANAQKGISAYLKTVWAITIAIGFFNLLPVPALDGGRLVFRFYEMISRRRMNERIEGYVHFGGVILLALLMLVVSKADLMR